MDMTFNFKSRIRFMKFSELLLNKKTANVCFLELCVIVLHVNFLFPWLWPLLAKHSCRKCKIDSRQAVWTKASWAHLSKQFRSIKIKEKKKNHEKTQFSQTYDEHSLLTLSQIWSQIPIHCGWMFGTKRYQWYCHEQIIVDSAFSRY